MGPRFPSIGRFEWWRGTFIGALIAYVLGYLPSTIMSMGETTGSGGSATEPAQWIVLLLAAGMGAVGGAVLSFAQWLVLRKKVQHAGISIPPTCWPGPSVCQSSFGELIWPSRCLPLWQSILLMAGTLFPRRSGCRWHPWIVSDPACREQEGLNALIHFLQ